jgi:hypothetical protein
MVVVVMMLLMVVISFGWATRMIDGQDEERRGDDSHDDELTVGSCQVATFLLNEGLEWCAGIW